MYRCALAVWLCAAWAVAQTPAQTPRQNYPNESRPSAPQSVQPSQQQPPQQQPTQTKPGYPEENPQTPVTGSQPPSSQGKAMSSDETLRDQLQRVLASNPRLSDVAPSVSSGEVTLAGTVPTESDRVDAKRMVEAVSGVNKVVDEMTIGTTSHQPPGGNTATSANPLPQSDAYGKGSSAQGAAHGCECKKGQNNGTYPGSDEPCACTGTTTHSGESTPKNTSPVKPVPPM
jgi:hypothetical protein